MYNPKTEKAQCDTAAARDTAIGAKPYFYLVYLIFYFVPWLFVPPTIIDILVAVGTILVFVPVYFHAHTRQEDKFIPYAIFMELLAFVTAPFNGMQGTYHIYACAQAGFLRSSKTAALLLCGLSAAYLTMAFLLDKVWIETALVVIMAAIIGISTIASAQQMERQRTLERTRVLDRQLAAVGERERIARDLHDLLGHTLTMVALKAEVAMKFIHSDPDRAKQEIGEIRAASRSALKDIRETVADMNFTSAAIEIMHARDALSAADISFTVSGNLPELGDPESKALGLAIRETVTNIIRHSQASEVSLVLKATKGECGIKLSDNGLAADVKMGSGLTGLHKRIEDVGGTVNIMIEAGMQVSISMPDGSNNSAAKIQ